MAVQFSQEVQEVEIDTINSGFIDDEENQFDTLCDGVINSLALFHTSNQEFLEFKDELMCHHLPSNLLLKLSLLSGKLCRYSADLNFPLTELIRLVRVYSSSWEEKSESLKKLHDDYEKKAKHLRIAIDRLALQEAEAKRIQKEKRLQNWERLFCKVQLKQGHGRRWKFKMHDFKTKAEKGREHLSAYFKLSAVSDEVNNSNRSGQQSTGPRQGWPVSPVKDSRFHEDDVESDDRECFEDTDSASVVPEKIIEIKEVIKYMPAPSPEPVETSEVCVGTGEPDYEDTLHLRLYNPSLENHKGITAMVQYGKLQIPVDCLASQQEIVNQDSTNEIENYGDKIISEPTTSFKPHKGFIGSKQRERPASVKSMPIKFREIVVPIPDGVRRGVINDPIMKSIKIQLSSEDSPEYFSYATIDMDDLKSLTLPIKDEEAVAKGALPTEESQSPLPFTNLMPTNFPLYDTTSEGKLLGDISIVLFWERKLITDLVNTATETRSLYEVVYEMTGIDLNVASPANLSTVPVETTDVCISPREQTPLPNVVFKEEFDEMIKEKDSEIEFVRQQYISRIEELEFALSQSIPLPRTPPSVESRGVSPHKKMKPSPGPVESRGVSPNKSCRQTSPVGQNTAVQTGASVAASPLGSKASARPSRSSGSMRFATPAEIPPTVKTIESEDIQKSSGHVEDSLAEAVESDLKGRIGKPEDHIRRMEMLANSAHKHRESLVRRVKAEVARDIEISLAGNYKLDPHVLRAPEDEAATGPTFEMALRDMTLPALFMPHRNSANTLYNPRAHQYFHPIGMKNLRLTQPPSMVALPPIKNQISVLSLFDMGDQFRYRRYLGGAVSTQNNSTDGGSGGRQVDLEAQPMGCYQTAFLDDLGDQQRENQTASFLKTEDSAEKSITPRTVVLTKEQSVIS